MKFVKMPLALHEGGKGDGKARGLDQEGVPIRPVLVSI